MTLPPTPEVEQPEPLSFVQRHRPALAGTGILLLVLFVFLMRSFQIFGYTSGDTYNTLRYAAHLNGGDGLVWNRGERPATEGFTSIVWIFVLTLPLRWGADPVLIAKIIGLFSTITTAGICLWVVTRMGRKWISTGGAFLCGVTAAAFFLLQADVPVHAVSGAETAPAVLLFTVFLLTAMRYVVVPRRVTAVVFATLAFFCVITRPEFTIAAAIAFAVAYRLTASPRQLLRYGILPFVGVGFVYFIWRAYRSWAWLPLPIYIRQTGEPRFLGGTEGVLAFMQVEWPLFLLALAAGWFIVRKGRSMLPVAVALVGLLIVLLIPARSASDHFRLFLPLAGFLSLFAGLGIATLAERFSERWLVTVLVLVVTAFFVWQSDRFGSKRSYVLEDARAMRNGYVLLGRALADIDPKGFRSLAIGSAPATAYYSNWYAIDLHGLNDREIALHRHAGTFDVNQVIGQRPDVLGVESRQGRFFDPPTGDAAALRDRALRSGFRPSGVLKIRDTLYLWLMTPDQLFARTVIGALERRSSPLVR